MDCINNIDSRCNVTGYTCTRTNIKKCMWTDNYVPETYLTYEEILDMLEITDERN